MAPTSAADARLMLPHVVSDPVASLRPWPIDVRLGQTTVHIPALPAADWLAVLMTEFTIWDLIPGLCPDDEDIAIQALREGQLTADEFQDACLQVITTATGRPWWFAVRLIQVAAASWEVVGGNLAKSSVDAGRISIGQWLDITLLVCLEGMKQEQTTMFLSQLEAPPRGHEEEAKELEMSVSEFMALR